MTVDLLSGSRALGGLYKGLAAASDHPFPEIVDRSPENPFLVGLAVASEEREEFRPLFEELWACLGDGEPDAMLRRLRIEHCRLFQGPGPGAISPYEGSYIAGGSPGGAVSAVSRAYGSAGATVSEEVRDRPDHVAAEVEFLGALCDAEAGTPGRELPLVPGEARKVREEFLRQHAGRWIPRYSGLVEEGAREGFYRVYGKAMAAAVRWDGMELMGEAELEESSP